MNVATQMPGQPKTTAPAETQKPKLPGKILDRNAPDVRGFDADGSYFLPSNLDEIDQEDRAAYRQLVLDLFAEKEVDRKEQKMTLFHANKTKNNLQNDLQLLSDLKYGRELGSKIDELSEASQDCRADRVIAHENMKIATAEAHNIISRAEHKLEMIQLQQSNSNRELAEAKQARQQILNMLNTDFLVCSKCGESRSIQRGSNEQHFLKFCTRCNGTMKFKTGIRNKVDGKIQALQSEFDSLGKKITNVREPLKNAIGDDAAEARKHFESQISSGVEWTETQKQFRKWKADNPILKAAAETINAAAQRRCEILEEIERLKKQDALEISNIEFC